MPSDKKALYPPAIKIFFPELRFIFPLLTKVVALAACSRKKSSAPCAGTFSSREEISGYNGTAFSPFRYVSFVSKTFIAAFFTVEKKSPSLSMRFRLFVQKRSCKRGVVEERIIWFPAFIASIKLSERLPVVAMAPFIIISLVENAFKHGVSTTEPSFISISITAGDGKIVCEITNSNHPKSSSDKSGHGIGLEQVARRLDLAYAGRYEWRRGVDKQSNVYFSKIIIYDTDLCDNRR